ncbi:hypothetical protein PLICRDRAFT_105391 [Plicaturopsis crispa FD-325 SS-3]|nr:hypothetical protein PLICRDRAFT_105391 [Plicaturopsis crispa FD-325 SS-3]
MTPSAKRQRTDHSSTSETLPTRWEPWIDDGNIVLQAENRQFRVHRSLLRSSSHVFSDMFEVCGPGAADQGSGEEATVDGCPVIHMADASQDWHYVLTALYDRGFYTDGAADVPFEVLAAFLRLGKKYGIRRLQAEAMPRLSAQFPTTLAAYDGPKCIDSSESNLAPKLVHDTTVAAINLARETNTPSLLPAAFYMYCAYDFDARVIRGYHKRDPSLPAISTADRDLCISARAKLVRAQLADIHAWTGPDLILACGDTRCIRRKVILSASAPLHCMVLARPRNWAATYGFCADCARSAAESQVAGRRRIWDELPSFFDLPDWKTLIEADRPDTSS